MVIQKNYVSAIKYKNTFMELAFIPGSLNRASEGLALKLKNSDKPHLKTAKTVIKIGKYLEYARTIIYEVASRQL